MPRTYSASRYQEYRQLCDSLGVPAQGKRWCSHYAELRRDSGRFVRLTRQQCIAWWRERFTDDELFEMGSALDFLTREVAGGF